ncbi:MAG TPA: pyridoxal-dependent decarboxylase, partial [Bdellovibrio sp.]|nr:pyridoxal-dependent decarboxylase [Bdellovibrio sp.]
MSKKCSPEEAALKSFFLGPQAENSNWVRHEILHVLDHWFQWRQDLFPEDGEAISREDQKSPDFQNRRLKTQEVLQELCRRFEAEIPQFSPRYVGHMYSEISLPALFGHFAALLHNPNNISTEAARVGAIIENEAIHDLAVMMGFDSEKATGHFTSGGTVANIEALWRARYRMDHFLSLGCYLNLHQGKNLSYCEAAGMGWDQFEKYLERYNIDEMNLKKFSVVAQGPWNIGPVYEKAYKKPFRGPAILVPNSKHYSWMKGISLLGFGDQAFVPVELDEQGVLDINSLQQQIEKSLKEDTPLMMIVSVAGTTELGQCDPIEQICEILSNLQQTRRLHIWHHVDAAYGGYFCSLLDNGESEVLDKNLAHSFAAIRKTDSVTIDPHKLGYVPYACGAFIVPDEIHYRVSAFDAKYIQSPNKNVDRWMKTLEGSRSASGAAATWMTAKTIGFNPDGYGKILNRAILARRQLAEDLKSECPNI